MSVIIKKINESYIQIKNYDKDLLIKLKDKFVFYAPNYFFSPKYRQGVWDGKIYLFNQRNDTLPIGLFKEAYKTIKSYTNDLVCDLSLFDKGYEISKEEIIKFCELIKVPFMPYDHQIEAIQTALKERKITLVSATGSGKSYILFLICNFLKMKNENEKILLVVPSVQLVEQMFKDFCKYAENYCDYSENIKKIYSGVKNYSKNPFITISTWQSIIALPKNKLNNVLSKYTTILCDEVHQANAKSLTEIISKCVNAKYKIGVTGSLSSELVHEKQLNGLFGPTQNIITAREMIDNDMSAEFNVKCLILDYKLDRKIELKNKISSIKKNKKIEMAKYNCEMDFIKSLDERMNFFVDFCSKIKKNTIVLFKSIDYGTELYKRLYKESKKIGKRIYYIDGNVKVDRREIIRENMERFDNVIVLASLKLFSTGINVKNVHNIVLAESIKSEITVIQSIGRVLRKLDDKLATYYDISDELSLKNWTNYSKRHYLSRLETYKKEQHNIVKTVKIKI
jgi:superfamily II DNA or RNA helicase